MERSDSAKIYPCWTESDVSKLVDIWCDLDENPAVHRPNRPHVAGGLDTQIAVRLSRQSSTARTVDALKGQRYRIHKVIRLIRSFDKARGASGGRLWFDMTNEERMQVKMNQRERKTSLMLSQESFNKLMKLESVRKCTETRDDSLPGENSRVSQQPSSRRTYWSVTEVRDLIHAWGQVMKQLKIPVCEFATRKYDKSAKLYTLRDRTSMDTWRKMKRIVLSYQFIRAFNDQHSPAQWFLLSNRAQNTQVDWSALPSNFEDITQDIFDRVQSVDDALARDSTSKNIYDNNSRSLNPPPVNKNKSPSSSRNCVEMEDATAQFENSQHPTHLEDAVVQCAAELRAESPHFVDDSSNSPLVDQTSDEPEHNNTQHQECIAFQEHATKIQSEQFQQAIHHLRVDIGRDLHRSADIVSTIFFERFGQPDSNGDATFVARLLKDNRQRVDEHFTRFKKETKQSAKKA